jgi:hypothetical protein
MRVLGVRVGLWLSSMLTALMALIPVRQNLELIRVNHPCSEFGCAGWLGAGPAATLNSMTMLRETPPGIRTPERRA